MENPYERINDYGSVSVRLASPEDIRSWSYGEVKKPETINYRTYRIERDGLFCERIFGPEKDWECFCGKYKGIKHKGIICDRCGVKITHSKVRRRRMGHINLAAPVIHIWFFKAVPSRVGTLLGIRTSVLERVIYYQDYIVTEPGDTDLQERQILTEEEYRRCVKEYSTRFKAEMGAEAVRSLLKKLKFDEEIARLRTELKETGSKQKEKDITKRLKMLEKVKASPNQVDWMVMDVVPVIPPDLRPLVFLESGNFATSDLNDLYRRVINRNNRLKKLIDLNAPEVIIRNEKRMLQQSVDSLFDNARCKRPLLGSNNRPLKSLTDMIKGKQGRFRENLLGKRVDYSGRSVIVVGPELKLHQCGLPKKIALELFQPFIIRRLKETGLVDTIKSAKKMLERKDDEVWDVLDEVIHRHPVLLNRAPTLHRMGIQAFEPQLVEGNAIKINPLVCAGFNADFDGDTMAVHLPLSIEAIVEAKVLMLSTNNIFAPSNGSPIMAPSQDMVLGCFYFSEIEPRTEGQKPRRFSAPEEAFLAFATISRAGSIRRKNLRLHERILLRMEASRDVRGDRGSVEGMIETTVGRMLFNDILPKGMPFYNIRLDSKTLGSIIQDGYRLLGREMTIQLLDGIKEFGFKAATRAGLSLSIHDLKAPPRKLEVLKKAEDEVARIQKNYERGIITEGERYNQVVDCWTHAREVLWKDVMETLRDDTLNGERYLNPMYMMAISGARGGIQQIGQLAGMRGLMAKPSGKIIENPIKANFREGLSVLEYFSSTHGSRKGLADTALKTADSGYLTRKLADVAQNIVINEHDCGTPNGVTRSVVYQGDKVVVPMWKVCVGRVSRQDVVDRQTKEKIVLENDLITEGRARHIERLGYDKLMVRSPLTCESPYGICAMCYGMDLSNGRLAEEGTAVGIVAAQSIGEPGTQLTMRTFHIGGTAHRTVAESEVRCMKEGTVEFSNLRWVETKTKEVVVLSRGEIRVLDRGGEEQDRYLMPSGAILKIKNGQKVTPGTVLAKWDPHVTPILTSQAGIVQFEDIVEGVTLREERDSTGRKRRVIAEHKGDHHPQIIVKDRNGEILGLYPVPEKAHLEVNEGDAVEPGAQLAKTPREIGRTQDITGGLPRVTELFEARKPIEPAIMSEIDGTVELGERKRGKRTIIVRPDKGEERAYSVPQGKHVIVHRGDRVRRGDPLVDGPLVLQDLLRINGPEHMQDHLLREIQNVYRSQNVTIDDKHLEIIVAQMMGRVKVEDPGDAAFLPGDSVTRHELKRENDRAISQKGKPATARPTLVGITKAALRSDSFLSAASFQDTTKVLSEAALHGKVDPLLGLKENVILGHLIPAGTGFKQWHASNVKKLVPEPQPVPAAPVETVVATEKQTA